MKARLGPEHPNTLRSMHNLAASYSALGRNQEALKLYEETLALNKAKLGPEHPNTLRSMNNLAKSYYDLSQTKEATKLFEETLALRKTKLGPEHLDTLDTMNELANAYIRLERWSDALVLLSQVRTIREKRLLGTTETVKEQLHLAWTTGQVGDARMGLHEFGAAAKEFEAALRMLEGADMMPPLLRGMDPALAWSRVRRFDLRAGFYSFPSRPSSTQQPRTCGPGSRQ